MKTAYAKRAFRVALPIRIHRALLGVLVSAAMISSTHAANVTWDTVPGTVGAGNGVIDGGAGTWNTVNGNWTTSAGATNRAWVNANKDTAIFGSTAGTVTLGENISAGGLTFNSTGYTISGAYTLDLLGSNIINTVATTTFAGGLTVANTPIVTNRSTSIITGSLVLTNGARLFVTPNGDLRYDPAIGKDSNGIILTIVGGASDSILDGGGGRLKVGETTGTATSTGNNKLVVDNGGIVTNVTELHIGKKGDSANYSYNNNNALVVTNGGKVFTSAASSIADCSSRGKNFVGNTATVTGTGSLWNLGGASLTLGFSGSYADNVTNNALIVSNGGVVTNAGLIYVSDGDATDCRFNSITVNNGSIYSVGLNMGDNGSPNNSVSVENGGTWNMGAGNITVGSGTGTGNAVTVGTGSVVTNAGTLSVASGNSVVLEAGGQIYATSAVVSAGGVLRVGCDNAQTPSSGRLTVSGNLNITGSTLDLTGKVSGVFVLAKYGTRTAGEFAVTNGLPAEGRIDYSYDGNQIAAVVPPAGTVLIIK